MDKGPQNTVLENRPTRTAASCKRLEPLVSMQNRLPASVLAAMVIVSVLEMDSEHGGAQMASMAIPSDKSRARVAIVEQHVRFENEHNLEGVLGTFGEAACYEDEAWGDTFKGLDGVRSFYRQLMTALPDLEILVQQRHVTDNAILLEVLIRGTHLGSWRGLPATGRRVEVPLCGVYTFDSRDQLAGERIYYDRATVLRQLGVFHEPESLLGRIATLATHPVTIASALLRRLLGAKARFPCMVASATHSAYVSISTEADEI